MFAVRRLVRAGLLVAAVAAVSVTVFSSRAGGGLVPSLGASSAEAVSMATTCGGLTQKFGVGIGPKFVTSGHGRGHFDHATIGVNETETSAIGGWVDWTFDAQTTKTTPDYGLPYSGKLFGELTFTVHFDGGAVGTFTSQCATEASIQGPHPGTGELEAEAEYMGTYRGDFPTELNGNTPVFTTFDGEDGKPMIVSANLGLEGGEIKIDLAIEFGTTCDESDEMLHFSTEGSGSGSLTIPNSANERGAIVLPPGCALGTKGQF